jgi:hypothetical protein
LQEAPMSIFAQGLINPVLESSVCQSGWISVPESVKNEKSHHLKGMDANWGLNTVRLKR